jgi:S-adenosylmethionine hydrolase
VRDDTLCPAPAHLVAGMPIAQLGTEVDPATLAGLDVAEPEVELGKIRCTVLDFNRFGNVQLNVREAELTAADLDEAPVLSIEAVSGSADARRGRTYADFGAGEYGMTFDPRLAEDRPRESR